MPNKVYRYAFLLRPPMPGGCPREGLLQAEARHGTAPSGHHAYGWADYDRELTEKEISDYDLEYVSSCAFAD